MGIEFKILDFIQTLRTPVLDKIMVFITYLGNGGIIWIAVCLTLLCIKRTRRTGLIVFLSLAADVILCNLILKNAVARIRPCDINTHIMLLVSRPMDYSFPSGHTAASFATVTALFLAKEKKIALMFLPLSCLIAFSRLYLYVHFPTDILGGALVGILSAVIGFNVLKTAEKYFRK